MLTAEENEKLTRVEPGAAMHDLLSRYWMPVLRVQRLEAGGAPAKVRLLGRDFAVYRSPDGEVRAADERCTHRCASLLLARNEPGGLRCIFHGWKFGPDGDLLEAPTEEPRSQAALARVARLRTYPAREAGGLVWIFVGEGDPPTFPDFEFTRLAGAQIDVKIAQLPVNWLQNLESILDTAHLGFLHRSSTELATAEHIRANVANQNLDTAPRLEFDDTDYGFREAAIRRTVEGGQNVRTREVALPSFVFLAGDEGRERPLVITVPVDDTHCLHICVTYNPYRSFEPGEVERIWFGTHPNNDDFSDAVPGCVSWPQDRKAMKDGHFSGIVGRHVFYEDFAVLQSMGPIVDRRREHLGHADATIVRMRKELLAALRGMEAERPPKGLGALPRRLDRIRTEILEIDAGTNWRSALAHYFIEEAE